jgi:glutathione-independent formaldehyde dehydrogenase
MASNRGVVFLGPNHVEVQSIDYPKLENPAGKKINLGVILKVVSTNICGSDQHMVRGRTTAPAGMVLGHEITGEVIELGSDVEYIKKGDLVTVPFNVACGRCRTCRAEETGVCLNVNPGRAGGAYGYVDMGGWIGGQAEYVMVPYADFNLIPFPDKAQAMAKITDLTMLTDILPTGFHGAINAGVGVGATVYVAGAGPVGMAAAASAHILGAAVVLVGDMNAERLAHVKAVGYEPIDLTKDASLEDQIAQILGKPEVDATIDAVGFEAKSHGHNATEAPAAVLNSLMSITRAAGSIGIPGGADRKPEHAFRPGVGKVAPLLHRPNPRAQVQPSAHAGHPARPSAHREDRQRNCHHARWRSAGLQGLRQGSCEEICHRSPQPDQQRSLTNASATRPR